MAKRKRLSPANPEMFGAAPETKSMLPRAPIADVAADAAQSSAFADVAEELRAAKAEGRMLLSLPVSAIALDHITRDRMVVDEAEMEALKTSIAARGQQTPVEVLETKPGEYGLISGWRRCTAIAQLVAEGEHPGQVLALLRAPKEASETYLAMVEENEIRVGLSYYERARIAVKAVEQGVFETEKTALLTLFRSASRAKRSKIRSFLPLVHALDGALCFPHLIGERLGLRLSSALETDHGLGGRARTALEVTPIQTAEEEATLLTTLLAAPKEAKAPPARFSQDLRPELTLEWDAGEDWLKISGAEMTPKLRDYLIAQMRRYGG